MLIPIDFQIVLTVILAVDLALFLLSAVNMRRCYNSEYPSSVRLYRASLPPIISVLFNSSLGRVTSLLTKLSINKCRRYISVP